MIVAYCSQLSNLPGLTSAWYHLESRIYQVTGWQSRSTAAMKQFDDWSSSQLERLQSPKPSLTQYPNFISTMIRSNLAPESALAEAKEMLGPGTDTTSATLAHILWGLAHDIVFQDELAHDLAAAGWPTDMSALEAVPRLRAATKEGIRWAGAAAAMLPRVVPEGGATLAGKFIPAGVSSPSMHNNWPWYRY
jgi:cytochrome P450